MPAARERARDYVERFRSSDFAKNIVVPKVVEPVNRFFDDEERPGETDKATDPDAAIDIRDDRPMPTPAAPTETGSAAKMSRAELVAALIEAPTPRSNDLADHEANDLFAATARTDAAAVAPRDDAPPAPLADANKAAGTNGSDGIDGVDDLAADEGASVDDAPLPEGAWQRRKELAMRVKDNVKRHNLPVISAGIAFWTLLAIPAALVATISIAGLVLDPTTVADSVEDNLSGANEDVKGIIAEQLESISSTSGGGLAVGVAVGILLALWSVSGAMAKMMATLNTIFDETETRKFFKLRGTAIVITVGAIVLLAGAIFLLTALPPILGQTAIGDAGRWALNISRFPALLVVMVFGLSLLYVLGPDRENGTWRPLTWGAAVGTVLWLLISIAFSLYTSSDLNSYNETYGSIAGVVMLLLWLYLTALCVLIGAEVDMARDRADAAER